jgi:hypothetical protein
MVGQLFLVQSCVGSIPTIPKRGGKGGRSSGDLSR